MEQPPGFVAHGEYDKVCLLKISLYGMKHSPCAWFDKFSAVALEFGLNKSKCDHSVFYMRSTSGFVLLIVYVHDIVITVMIMLKSHFLSHSCILEANTKDMGGLKYFLGV